MKRKDRSRTPEPEGGFNNPFAKLKSLAADLPPGPAPEPEVEEPNGSDSSTSVPKRVVIRLERQGHGGKEVTVVSHLAVSEDALDELLLKLKSKLGVGGRRQDDVLVLQGDQRDRVEMFFRELGVKRISK